MQTERKPGLEAAPVSLQKAVFPVSLRQCDTYDPAYFGGGTRLTVLGKKTGKMKLLNVRCSSLNLNMTSLGSGVENLN